MSTNPTKPTTNMMRPDAKPPGDGNWAYLIGWAAEANPHPSGSDAAAKWAGDWAFQAHVVTGIRARATEEQLRAVHGDELCHICGKPQRGPGEMICSYPHGMLPTRAIGDGWATWEQPQ